MQKDLWQGKWTNDPPGFHLDEVNQHLKKHLKSLELTKNPRTLVPLCGKSLDLLYLRELRHDVIGVELIKKAVELFWKENELSFDKIQIDQFELYTQNHLSIWLGDFFNIPAHHLGQIDFIYDRASLIALP